MIPLSDTWINILQVFVATAFCIAWGWKFLR